MVSECGACRRTVSVDLHCMEREKPQLLIGSATAPRLPINVLKWKFSKLGNRKLLGQQFMNIHAPPSITTLRYEACVMECHVPSCTTCDKSC